MHVECTKSEWERTKGKVLKRSGNPIMFLNISYKKSRKSKIVLLDQDIVKTKKIKHGLSELPLKGWLLKVLWTKI